MNVPIATQQASFSTDNCYRAFHGEAKEAAFVPDPDEDTAADAGEWPGVDNYNGGGKQRRRRSLACKPLDDVLELFKACVGTDTLKVKLYKTVIAQPNH